MYNSYTDWANNLWAMSFEDILKEIMENFQNEGWGVRRGLHGGPKGPKMAKIEQNLELFP